MRLSTLITCGVCHLPKKPMGRDAPAALAGSLCTGDCPGYWWAPTPSSLWPEEMPKKELYEALFAAESEVERAKKEPAHSPTEDALIDALDQIIIALRASARYSGA